MFRGFKSLCNKVKPPTRCREVEVIDLLEKRQSSMAMVTARRGSSGPRATTA